MPSVDIEVVPSGDVEVVPSVDIEVVPSIDVEFMTSVDVEVVPLILSSSTLLSSPDICCSSPYRFHLNL
ncbi:hypothetical protein F2Q68_00010303 [Brassica cretica]|uniref:Uncharacterized protein n=1 Tax=Brassica cretica TaxID=69181 RepID=A0A8S9KS74_BRACR|nr:hypothetical protein F2Q68_00010303 [Brassica cretica]